MEQKTTGQVNKDAPLQPESTTATVKVEGGVIGQTEENFTKIDKKYQFSGNEQTKERKEKFILFYKKTLGSIKDTCEGAGIARPTYYDWVDNDTEFKRALKNAFTEKMEDVERQLNKLIMETDGPSVRYWLDRRHPEFMPRIVNEIKGTGENTMTQDIKKLKEVLLKKNESITITNADDGTDKPRVDSPLSKDKKQEGGNGVVRTEQSPKVLLEKKDETKSNSQSPTKGNIQNNRRGPAPRLHTEMH
jgi:hypothetical protein